MQMTGHMGKQEAALPQARRVSGRLLLFIAAPVGWMVAAWLHPAPNADRIYEDLASAADRWLIVHLLQLVLTLGIGASLWIAVRGRQGIAATVTRLAVPVYLVFFAAFDSVAGIASGLAVRHASSLNGAERDGAASTAESLLLNGYGGDGSLVAAISTTALSCAIVGVAMSFRTAGASRMVWMGVLGGVLLNLHAAGVIPIVGLAALSCSLCAADRRGLLGPLW
jgi:hypothetical protein